MLNKKIVLCGLLFTSFSLLRGMQGQESAELVLYKHPCDENIKKFLDITKKEVFTVFSLNFMVKDSVVFVNDIAQQMKNNLCQLWITEKNLLKDLFHKQDKEFIDCLIKSSIMFKIPKNQIGAVRNLKIMAEWPVKNFFISNEEYKSLDMLPVSVKQCLLQKDREINVELPWYRITKNQHRTIGFSGLITGLIGGISVFAGMCLGGGSSVLSLRDCASPVFGATCISVFIGSTAMYGWVILGREKKEYETVTISPDTNQTLDWMQKKSFE